MVSAREESSQGSNSTSSRSATHMPDAAIQRFLTLVAQQPRKTTPRIDFPPQFLDKHAQRERPSHQTLRTGESSTAAPQWSHANRQHTRPHTTQPHHRQRWPSRSESVTPMGPDHARQRRSLSYLRGRGTIARRPLAVSSAAQQGQHGWHDRFSQCRKHLYA
jgi:hypothetical protein